MRKHPEITINEEKPSGLSERRSPWLRGSVDQVRRPDGRLSTVSTRPTIASDAMDRTDEHDQDRVTERMDNAADATRERHLRKCPKPVISQSRGRRTRSGTPPEAREFLPRLARTAMTTQKCIKQVKSESGPCNLRFLDDTADVSEKEPLDEVRRKQRER